MWGKWGTLLGGSVGILWTYVPAIKAVMASKAVASVAGAGGIATTATVSIPVIIACACIVGVAGKFWGKHQKNQKAKRKVKQEIIDRANLESKTKSEIAETASRELAHSRSVIDKYHEQMMKNNQEIESLKKKYDGLEPMERGETQDSIKNEAQRKMEENNFYVNQINERQATSQVWANILNNPGDFKKQTADWIETLQGLAILALVSALSLAIFIRLWPKIMNFFKWIWSFIPGEDKKEEMIVKNKKPSKETDV